jgi:hypothetical protein
MLPRRNKRAIDLGHASEAEPDAQEEKKEQDGPDDASGFAGPAPPAAGYMTVAAFVRVFRIDCAKDLSADGKAVAQMCRHRKLIIKKVADARWGQVNAYPIAVLKEHFEVQ